MKLLPALCSVSLLLTAMPLLAQDPAAAPTAPTPAPEALPESPAADAALIGPAAPSDPSPSVVAEPTPDLMPAQPSQILPSPSTPEPSLIPEAPTLGEKPRGSAIDQPRAGERSGEPKTEKKSSTDLSNSELQQRIRLRQAKTRALSDAAIQAEWRKAETAHTDFEKRAALKRYYTLLYTRMSKLDGSLKAKIAELQRVALRRLDQTRIDPTEQPTEIADRNARLDLN